jgi:hypothetical protein
MKRYTGSMENWTEDQCEAENDRNAADETCAQQQLLAANRISL